MKPKPDACQGCPLYGDGRGFVPDELVDGAEVFVLGQNPGVTEETQGKPFVGRTGEVMHREYFPEAGLTRETTCQGNAIRCRAIIGGKRSNKLPAGKVLAEALVHCTAAHLRIPDSTRLIIATGAVAWQATGNPKTISAWRGYLGPKTCQDRPVLGVLHIADLFGDRNARMRLPSHRDWRKVKLGLSGEWPQRLPPRVETLHPSLAFAPWLALDTEYNPETLQISVVGVGGPGTPIAQVTAEEPGLVDVLNKPLVMQNVPADVRALRAAGWFQDDQGNPLSYRDIFERLRVDDTMLAHSVLWAEWPHTLEFLASVYGPYGKYKHLSKINPKLYNAGDVADTVTAWVGIKQELANDPASEAIYREELLPLLPVVMEAHERGIRINAARVRQAREECEAALECARDIARQYTGDPEFNLGSTQQLQRVLYAAEGLPIQTNKKTKRPSLDADSLGVLRSLRDPVPDLEQEALDGHTLESMQRRIAAGAHPLLEARVLYAGVQQVMTHYLKHCFAGTRVRERLYPEFHLHPQANGRWSTVNPPMAQLPSSLRDIVCPDPGTVWLCWDWDQIELRINALMCHDEPSIEAFAKGWDVHTLSACELFGLPAPPFLEDPHKDPRNQAWREFVGWKGKDDPRRVFTKRFVYRLDYGGNPRLAGNIPGAKALNLTPLKLVQASNRYLAAHPAKAAWRRAERQRIARGNAVVENFIGRKRRITETGERAWKIAFDYPMQAGVSSIANRTAIRIERDLPWLQLMFQMHDGWYYQCPEARAENTLSVLRTIVEAEWSMYGQRVRFPATFKVRRAP